MNHALRAVDVSFGRFREEAQIPGIAWGVVHDGSLVHAAGAGTLRLHEARTPDADSIFRIASMTKSFTAGCVLHLRDRGQLGLDDPVRNHVPELTDWDPPAVDTPPVTLRQLLSMSSGLPADDAWADRQLGSRREDLSRLLASKPVFAWTPGTAFEYSNLGYAILGRVIENVTGGGYQEFVGHRLLRPLDLASTTFAQDGVPAARLASGYVRREGNFVLEGSDASGAMAAIGGLWSSVRDLSRWISGFLEAFPARDDPDHDHPLARSTRREMQQVHRMSPTLVHTHALDEAPRVEAGGYGLGLFVRLDPNTGTRIGHPGGLPGFGSHMAWHPATGLGVVALANIRYAPVERVVEEVLTNLVESGAFRAKRPTLRPTAVPLTELVDRLIADWDDDLADEIFGANMDLDVPRDERRREIAGIIDRVGSVSRDATRPMSLSSPTEATWWLRGNRGWARVAIALTPEAHPRLQELTIQAIGDPTPEMNALAWAVLGLTNATGGSIEDLALAEGRRPAAVRRSLVAARVRFGRLALGKAVDGDGASAATFEVSGDHGDGLLMLRRDQTSGRVTHLAIHQRERRAPPEGW